MSQRKWRFHLVRGARCLEVGDFVGAHRHFETAHREAPGEAIVCLAWGRELLRTGELEGAERLLRQAWSLDSSLDSAAFALARLLGLHADRRQEALDVLDEVERQRGVDAPSVLLRGEIAVADPSCFAEAITCFARARQLGADEELVRLGLAKAHNAEGIVRGREGDHHQALFALKRAADLDPEWSGPRVNSGAIFERLGQLRKARAHYHEALRLDPVNPVALYNLAESLRREGSYSGAARFYRRLLAVQPDYPGGEDGLRLTLAAHRPQS
ncbi:MAG: tetratricopeptide repeat protein [bacterium]